MDGRVIVITSGKGGVGKSLVTSMLAVTMQRRGYKAAILDADITALPDGRFCMMYVAQTGESGVKMAISDSINGGYQFEERWIDFEPRACEAPNVWKRIGEDKWVVMYDVFSIRPHNFGFAETTDFKNFTHLGHFNEGVMKAVNFQSPKHGSVIQITKEEAERLENYWKEKKSCILFI